MFNKNRDGFTLIELLTVIAIIGILAAILIPAVGAAKIAAKKAQTKTQFSQWATAMNLFKQEYGYYPTFGTAASNTTAASLKNQSATTQFLDLLSAQTYSGGASGTFTTETTSPYGNTKLLSFYSLSNNDLGLGNTSNKNPGQLQDAFGNIDIWMAVDTGNTGFIKQAAVSGSPTAISTGKASYAPTVTSDIQAGVIFYSAGAGRSATDIVYSWQ